MVSVTILQDRCVHQATIRAYLGCSIHSSKGKVVSTLVFSFSETETSVRGRENSKDPRESPRRCVVVERKNEFTGYIFLGSSGR